MNRFLNRGTGSVILVLLMSAGRATAQPSLTLVPDDVCYETSAPHNLVTVRVNLAGASSPILAAQFFLQYNNLVLDFQAIEAGDPPFTNRITWSVDEGAGTIDYAGGVVLGMDGATSGTVAIVTFQTLQQTCDTGALVTFRAHFPPSKVVDENVVIYSGAGLTLTDVEAITIDGMAPTITCPADVTVGCGDPTDPAHTGTATTADNCDPAPVSTFQDTPVGGGCSAALVRTWTATDACDLFSTCDQVIYDTCILQGAALSFELDNPSHPCVRPGEPLTVTLAMFCVHPPVRGYQAFVAFQPARLTFQGGAYIVPGAFDRPIITPITATPAGAIDLAAGINDLAGQPPAAGDADLVRLTFNAGLTEGITTLSFRVHEPPTQFSDADGQPLIPQLLDSPDIFIDGTAPTITCPTDVTIGSDPGLCGALVNLPQPTANDPGGSGVAGITAYRSDGLGLNEPYPVGTTTVTWVATDCAGNSASCQQQVTVNDTEAPTITCPANVIGPNAALGTCEATVLVPPPTAAADNCEVASVVNNHTGIGDASGVYPVGVTTVTWTVTDIYGNTAQCSHTVTVGDGEPPTIACPANVFGGTDPGVCQGTVTVGAPITADNCAGSVTVTNSFNGTSNASGTYPLGTTLVTWTATDVGGNTAQCTHLVTIRDDEPPSVTCPATVMHAADPGVCQATFGFGGPTYSDNCAVASVTNSQTGTSDPTATYPVGTTPVTWTVTDSAGNPSTCTHNVVVTDEEAPVVTCGPDVTTNADAGTDHTFVNVPGPTAWDACVVGTITNSYTGTSNASGVYFLGTTAVTWTVFDAAGNSQTCVQNVTVLGVNPIEAYVQLSPVVTGPFTRCITFEVFACDDQVSVVREAEIAFDANGLGTALLEAPYDVYHCITARDRLHTLRRTDEGLHIEGGRYVADFTGDPAANGDWLIGGNLNDDRFIDILDFGVFINQYGTDYGSPDTTCSTPRPQADISGNSMADLADFTFVQINFLKVAEPNCCNLPGREGAEPVRSIPTREARKYGILPSADLNRDGSIDEYDMVEFMNGVTPKPPTPEMALPKRPVSPFD